MSLIRGRLTDRGLLIAVGTVAILVFTAVIGASIAGSYLLMIHYVDQAAQARTTLELHSAVATCKALVTLGHAGDGVKFPHIGHAHPSELALARLFAGIHQVVTASHCTAILNGTYHPPG